jgi:hypothetical protein
MKNKPDPLRIAVRVFSEPANPTAETKQRNSKPSRMWRRPDTMFVFDTETTTDALQRLTFGSYRYIVKGQCVEEGLFYADDLPEVDRRTLKAYAATHYADTPGHSKRPLKLLTRTEFANLLYKAAYKSRCLLVGFNLPFDLSRVAVDVTTARGRFAGGFSLGLWSYFDPNGQERPNPHRPRIGIKHIDSKRALKGFTARLNPDRTDLIPEGSPSGEPQKGYRFRGHFLDLRTLAFALTDVGYSLEGACEAFGVEHAKKKQTTHGLVTPAYIDYNRRDVLATSELAVKLLEEYDRHPIELQATRAYSPASIGKAYLRDMGIKPVLQRQPDFLRRILGYAQSAFFGGRASAHIRKCSVPVVYTDFLSMYPTVNSLMGLWRFVIAKEIRVIEHCQVEIQAFLRQLKKDALFDPATWKQLPAFVQIIPDGDVLPARGKYSAASNDWQVGLNHLHADPELGKQQALWYSLPDVVTSVLLTGRVPEIIDAFRIEPRGTLPGLKSTMLRGAIEIDPRKQDFFTVVIEERRRLKSGVDLNPAEKDRLDKALKVLANAASYGIYAETIRQESDEQIETVCFGIDESPFTCCVSHPDAAGEYCFPPLASLITGAARLMLSLLEHSITDLGGTYAMEDTDSMAIVATKSGGLVPCPGGPYQTRDGREAVKALSWKQVAQISEQFAALNPYDRSAVPGSILKIEDENYTPKTRRQRQLYCFAISAKRYVLFVRDKKGRPVLLRENLNNDKDRWSEHGLGHLLNPTDLQSGDRHWIAEVWRDIVHRAEGLASQELAFKDVPAVGRVTISSPAVLRSFAEFNAAKAYADQIKPFNFVLTCQTTPLGHPTGADPEHFHLIAPYELDPRKWLKHKWIDQYSGTAYRITTDVHHGSRNAARVKTYGDILLEYEYHPESKCADADGNTCKKQTIGLLQRRHIQIGQIKYIGKESNSIEDVESGMIQSAEKVYTGYPDPRRDEWQTKILPAIKKLPLGELVKRTGLSRRALIDWRAGRSRPHSRNRERLTAVLHANQP